MLILPFAPAQDSTLKLGWNTNVLSTLGGFEQRHALRWGATQAYSYAFDFLAPQYQRFANWYRGNGPAQYQQPRWWWAVPVGLVAASSTEITISDTLHTFVAGDQLMLYSHDTHYVKATVDVVSADKITLSEAVAADYPAAYLIALDDAVITDVSIGRKAGQQQTINLETRLISELQPLQIEGLSLFKGLPIQSNPSINVSDIAEKIHHNFDIIDENTGPFDVYRQNPFVKLESGLEWRAKSISEVNELLQLFAHTEGQQKPFWVPSFSPLTYQASAGKLLTIANAGFEYIPTPFYLYIWQENSIECIEVVSVTSGPATDLLTLAAPLAHAINASKLIMLCTLTRMRQQTDIIEIKRETYKKYTTSFAVTEVLDEL